MKQQMGSQPLQNMDPRLMQNAQAMQNQAQAIQNANAQAAQMQQQMIMAQMMNKGMRLNEQQPMMMNPNM